MCLTFVSIRRGFLAVKKNSETMGHLFFRSLALTFLIIVISCQTSGKSVKRMVTPELFNIGAFNIRSFGKRKMSNSEVAEMIARIVERYDVILLQEIRDQDGSSVEKLQQLLTRPYSFVLSEQIGRTTYKERYAFFYRPESARLLDKQQYKDTDDVFEREPYTVHLELAAPGKQKVALVGLHSKPGDAVEEIGNLSQVIDSVMRDFGPDVQPIVLGDLNADCDYASTRRRTRYGDKLTIDSSYVWIIKDNIDTTVRESTDCAYDRIIVRSEFASHVVEAGAYNFCEHMELTEEECLKISDHYPVEMTLEL